MGTQQQQQQSNRAPPASQSAISTLPTVCITADDLLEAANKECCVCLEEQKLGGSAVKLQCGHIFHRPCLVDWLKLQCTCPVCRFEIETDDRNYEAGRKNRMKKRKLRFRMDEIKGKSISQLRDLAASLEVSIAGCLDKHEMIERLVASGHVSISESLPPVEIPQSEFLAKSVSELKHLLLSFGISSDNVLEKSELRSRLMDSGRIVLILTPEEIAEQQKMLNSSSSSPNSKLPASSSYDYDYNDDADMKVDSSSTNNASSSSSSNVEDKSDLKIDSKATFSSSSSGDSGKMSPAVAEAKSSGYSSGANSPAAKPSTTAGSSRSSYSLDELKSMSLGELRAVCRNHSIKITQCIDKSEVVDCIAKCRSIQIVPSSCPVEAEAKSSPSTGSSAVSTYTLAELDQMDSKALRRLVSEYGLDEKNSGSMDSYELKQLLQRKGCVRDANESEAKANGSSKNHNSSSSSSNSSSNEDVYMDEDDRFTLTLETLHDMTMGELMSIMNCYNINSEGCTYRDEIIERMKTSPSLRIVE